MPKLNIVGGIINADEKGEVEIPPTKTFEIKEGKKFIEIPVKNENSKDDKVK